MTTTYTHTDQIVAANKAVGGHFFDASSMRLFRTRVYPDVYGGKYFVTSDFVEEAGRGFTVRAITSQGQIRTASEFLSLPTLAAAQTAAKAIVAALEEIKETADESAEPYDVLDERGDVVASYASWALSSAHARADGLAVLIRDTGDVIQFAGGEIVNVAKG
jgi:hypothetical protein